MKKGGRGRPRASSRRTVETAPLLRAALRAELLSAMLWAMLWALLMSALLVGRY